MVEYRWKYLRCQDEEVPKHPIPEAWIGMTVPAIRAMEQGAAEVEHAGGRLVVRGKSEDWCPVDAVYRSITITGGHVTGYRGRQADPRFMLERSRSAVTLDAATRRVLRDGILARGDEEVRRLLEGTGD